jgi:hypothetical protein
MLWGMPALKDRMRQAAEFANKPMLQREALQHVFAGPPKELSALPKYYMQHLRQVFASPRNLRLALTDLTPLGLLQTALTVPAAAHMLGAMPNRKLETMSGLAGNVLGGQLMQRTGLMGGLLGGLAGEVAGRAVAMPFSKRKSRDALSETADNRIQKIRDTAQRLDDLLGSAQEKIGTIATNVGYGGAEGMTQPNPTVMDAEFAGTSPRLQPIPGEQGSRQSIANRGKTIDGGDNLMGTLIRILGKGTPLEASFTDDSVSQHTDFEAIWDGYSSTIGGVPNVNKRIKDRAGTGDNREYA